MDTPRWNTKFGTGYARLPAFAVNNGVCYYSENFTVSLSPLDAKDGDLFAVTCIDPKDGKVTGYVYAPDDHPQLPENYGSQGYDGPWEKFANFEEAFQDAISHMPLMAVCVTPKSLARAFGLNAKELNQEKLKRLTEFAKKEGILYRMFCDATNMLDKSMATVKYSEKQLRQILEDKETPKKQQRVNYPAL